MARIGDARVTRIHKDRREPCTNFHDRRWDCGPRPEAWLYVGVERMDMGDAIREVIWAHPLDKGEPTEIRWPSIPAGRRLVIRYGLNQRAVDSSTFGVAPTFRSRCRHPTSATTVFASLPTCGNDQNWAPSLNA